MDRGQALAAIDADHLQAVSGQPAAMEAIEEALPFGDALGAGETDVDGLLPAVGAQAQGLQDRALEGAGAGLAAEHHAVEHQGLVVVGQGPGMEGLDRSAPSRLLATRLKVDADTGRPSRASRTSPTLRVPSPDTKSARVSRDHGPGGTVSYR